MTYGHGEFLLRAVRGASKPNVEALKARKPDLTAKELHAGYHLFHNLPDGRYTGLQVVGAEETLLVVGTHPNLHYDRAYRYARLKDAAAAFTKWDGNGTPPGPCKPERTQR
jgi:hypothetical protein